MTKEKEPSLRVYPITDAEGKKRHVKAPNLAAAIVHVYEPKCGDPLSGAEVAAVYEAGGKVETVKAKAAPAPK